jgi:hypothetical protein
MGGAGAKIIKLSLSDTDCPAKPKHFIISFPAAVVIERRNSLFCEMNSLILRINSLFCCVGNSSISH